MKIALVQTNPVIGDFSRNTENIAEWAEKAKQQSCDLVIFPEMAVAGYPPQDLLDRPSFLRDHAEAFQRLLSRITGIGVIIGVITPHTASTGKPLHNSAVLFYNKKILFSAQKRLLPFYDVFDEARYFEPGSESRVFNYKGMTFGLTICEDIFNDKDFFPRRFYTVDPTEELYKNSGGKVEMLINLSASPFHIGKFSAKKKIFSKICTKYRIPLAYVNQVGGQDSLLFDGQSLAMNPQGEIIAMAARFRKDMVIFDTDSSKNNFRSITLDKTTDQEEIDAVFEALVMGTRDYVSKCGFKKGILGLSGGIDSALTAAIACDALGAENVMGVALPSPYSSKESIEDAQQLAQNLKVRFEIIPISDIFQTYRKILGDLLATSADSGPSHDVTEQNIQARIRGNLLMALANKLGGLLLSTGNKSEMAVGYCTLYGDMSGGLAVISDVPKEMVYKLAGYVNRDQEIIPSRTVSKPPSAELAPNQKDEDDLPPYSVLDPILKAYLEENLSIREIIDLGFPESIVKDVVMRIRINEYKRKQAPIGLKVTTKAFGYGRRYPTAQNYREKVIDHGVAKALPDRKPLTL